MSPQRRPGELERIRWLRRVIDERAARPAASDRHAGASGALPPFGPGDDAAAWRPPAGSEVVLTVDVQVEGVHFRRAWLSPRELGRRAVATAASDLAAMAAAPAGVLLSLTLPSDCDESWFRRLFLGLVEEADRLGLAVLGGNLSRGPLGVTTTAVGYVRAGKAVRRSGARRDDGVFVTGFPGRSRVGRALVELEESEAPRPGRARARSRTGGRRSRQGSRAAAACRRAFCSPAARVGEAIEIARRVPLHAMVDISDGLARDLAHVLAESSAARGVELGAVLERDALSRLLDGGGGGRERPCVALCRELGLEPLRAVLDGGEDYELLFTAAPAHSAPLERLARRLELPITSIGRIVAGRGIEIVDAGGRRRRWRAEGWDHFAG